MIKIKAILFGSIGTIVETSEIQRVAFNKAFKISGLNWYWSKVQYQKFLKKPGGEKRIKKYAKSKKKLVNSLKIRNLKTRLFNNYIIKNKLKPRKGIIKLIKECKRYNIKLGFVSTTSLNNINSIFLSLNNYIKKKDFNFIGHNRLIKNQKPSPEIYNLAINKLKIKHNECIAIEDSAQSMKSAKKANIKCVVFPGKYHKDDKFKGAYKVINNLNKFNILEI
mgnify:FL=1